MGIKVFPSQLQSHGKRRVGVKLWAVQNIGANDLWAKR